MVKQMLPDCDCDNPHVVFVRAYIKPDGIKNTYYKCLSCGKDQIISEDTKQHPTEKGIASE